MEVADRDLLIRIDTNVRSMMDRIKNIETDLSVLKTDNATNKQRIETSEEEIDKLRDITQSHNWVNTGMAIIAGVLAILRG